MEKKQTAVEWYIEQRDMLESVSIEEYWERKKSINEQAKQMEKEQIVESHHEGYYSFSHSGEQYYNETYGGTQC
jgi:hypothetical protein